MILRESREILTKRKYGKRITTAIELEIFYHFGMHLWLFCAKQRILQFFCSRHNFVSCNNRYRACSVYFCGVPWKHRLFFQAFKLVLKLDNPSEIHSAFYWHRRMQTRCNFWNDSTCIFSMRKRPNPACNFKLLSASTFPNGHVWWSTDFSSDQQRGRLISLLTDMDLFLFLQQRFLLKLPSDFELLIFFFR